MPTSPYAHLYSVVEYLSTTRPASLLDVGLGNGKLGFLARDLLDVMLGERYWKEDWQVKIDGIEIFPEYVQDHQKAIYDEIYFGDAFDIIDTLGTYDMIMLGDVLEHFEKQKALEFFDKCVAHANEGLIVCIPLGEKWVQPEIYGNPYEKHLSYWQSEEFEPFSCTQKYFEYSPGPYGAFLVKKNDYLEYKVNEFQSQDKPIISNYNCNLREKYSLNKDNIAAIDLSSFSRYVANAEHRNYFFDKNFREHYRLIAYLSTLFSHSDIFDIRTNLGYSALALSYNRMNRVISYDITECKELNHPDELTSIDYVIGEVRLDDRLLGAPLIMLDTNHDGEFENQFYAFLKQNDYRGLLFLDDIHLNQPMIKFWNAIVEPKEDLTDLGHWSGSGIVEF
jgi:hypothetical protein